MSRRGSRRGGFTLLEVMLALVILGTTALLLLDRRVEIVREAAQAHDERVAWVLASQKFADLELDPTLWSGAGSQSSGDFSDVEPSYAVFLWDYVILRQPVETFDPKEAKPGEKPKELLRLTLAVRGPSLVEPVVIEAMLPIRAPKAPGPTPAGEGPAPPGEKQP